MWALGISLAPIFTKASISANVHCNYHVAFGPESLQFCCVAWMTNHDLPRARTHTHTHSLSLSGSLALPWTAAFQDVARGGGPSVTVLGVLESSLPSFGYHSL